MVISKIGDSFKLGLEWISRVLNYIGISTLAVIALVTTADVLMRAFFRESILGIVEVTEYVMIVLVYFGLGWCALQGAHAKVDLMVGKLSARGQAVFDTITILLGLAIAVLISWQGYGEFLDDLKTKVASSIIGIPRYPFYLCLAIGCSAFSLVLLKNLIQSIIKAVKG